MAEAMIDIHDMQNVLGGQVIHDGLNLTVHRGEIMAIVGGSGSGKTTILRNILMLLTPTAGSVEVFGVNVFHCSEQQAKALRQRWGMMFQHGALFSSLTVLENIIYPLHEFTDLDWPDMEQIALLKITLAGLDVEAASKYPAELSGGMLKRASLARAIALDPELLFLDEPTAGLDPQSASSFDELVLHLRDSLGLTVVMVTHDLDTLWRVTDKVAFLGEKKVLAALSMPELVKYDHPLIHDYFSGPRGQQRT